MQVRKATTEDEGQIISLLKLFPPDEITVDWEVAHSTYQRVVENPDLGTILVAEENGDVAGVITLSYPTAVRCGGLYTCIEEFVVAERVRGKGVGGQLLLAAIAEATTRGCYEIQVNNPSQLGYPLYLRHGLKDIGKHLKAELPHQTH